MQMLDVRDLDARRTLSGVDSIASELQAGLAGRVILPSQGGYDDARRLWNAAFDRRPSLVIQPDGAADVAQVVRIARREGLPLTVKSGGHSVAGQSVADGALLLDLSRMKQLTIDADRRITRAGTGLTAGEYSGAAHQYGLATPFGDTASVGIGGITLGGGIGWLTRKYGLTVDNLLSAELVTADGEIVRAGERDNADLFWALRGGGGNFGIATAFEYRLHPVGTVVGGAVVYPLEEAQQVIRDWTQYALAAPDGLTTIGDLMPAPPAPFIPPAWHGRPVIIIGMVFAGDLTEGERVVTPLRRLGTPVADIVGPMPYPAIYNLTEDAAKGGKVTFVRSMFAQEVDSSMIDAIAGSFEGLQWPLNIVQIRPLGGTMSRTAADATAFPHRDKNYMLSIFGEAPDWSLASIQEAWTDGLFETLRPRAVGAYMNFLGDEGGERLQSAYTGNYGRLAALKRKYDPNNFFRSNQNIRP